MVKAALRRQLRKISVVRRLRIVALFGDTRRTAPLDSWGTRRGLPVDRCYIERFLAAESRAIRGSVLEVKEDLYASRLGASCVDVVDIDPGNAHATITGDLCTAGVLPRSRFDAVIVTQTLQLVADPAAAVGHLLSSLRPGGTLLLTVPCLSRIVDGSDRWRWTPVGMRELLEAASPTGAVVRTSGMGNGLVARAFLFGLATEDLSAVALTYEDDAYPLLVAATVTLPGSS